MTKRESEMLATVTQTLIEVIVHGRETIELDRILELDSIIAELNSTS